MHTTSTRTEFLVRGGFVTVNKKWLPSCSRNRMNAASNMLPISTQQKGNKMKLDRWILEKKSCPIVRVCVCERAQTLQ